MNKLIEIHRVDKQVRVEIHAHPTDPTSYFSFPLECPSAWTAELLKNFLSDQLSWAIWRAKDSAYRAGWRESNIPKYKRHYSPVGYLEK